jgi:hypothetical protein
MADIREFRAERSLRCTHSATRLRRGHYSPARALTSGVLAGSQGRNRDTDGLRAGGGRRSPAGLPQVADGSRVRGRPARSARWGARLGLSQSPRRRARGPHSRGQLDVREVGLTPRYPRCVASERSKRGLQSVELNDERVRAALIRIDEMSDTELRELVRGEPQMFVEAAEGIIARRQSGE